MTASDPQWVRVRAVPADPSGFLWLIECNLCGIVGMIDDAQSDEASLLHLEAHKVDTQVYRAMQESQSTEHPDPDPEHEVPD